MLAGASTSIYETGSVVQGHHVCKTVWTPIVDETLEISQEYDNNHVKYAVAIIRRGRRSGTYHRKYQEFEQFSTPVFTSVHHID